MTAMKREKTRTRRRDTEDIMPRRKGVDLKGVKEIDLNDPDFLRQFMTDHGKIVPSRLTGVSARLQRQIKQGIRRCRTMGLLA
jgi:small subunit ribosomal protein S18